MPLLTLASDFWLDIVLVHSEWFLLGIVLAVLLLDVRHDVRIFPNHVCLQSPHAFAVVFLNLSLNHGLRLWFGLELLFVYLWVLVSDKPRIIPLVKITFQLLICHFDGLPHALSNVDVTHVVNILLFLLNVVVVGSIRKRIVILTKYLHQLLLQLFLLVLLLNLGLCHSCVVKRGTSHFCYSACTGHSSICHVRLIEVLVLVKWFSSIDRNSCILWSQGLTNIYHFSILRWRKNAFPLSMWKRTFVIWVRYVSLVYLVFYVIQVAFNLVCVCLAELRSFTLSSLNNWLWVLRSLVVSAVEVLVSLNALHVLQHFFVLCNDCCILTHFLLTVAICVFHLFLSLWKFLDCLLSNVGWRSIWVWWKHTIIIVGCLWIVVHEVWAAN